MKSTITLIKLAHSEVCACTCAQTYHLNDLNVYIDIYMCIYIHLYVLYMYIHIYIH